MKLIETDGKIHLTVWDNGLGIPIEIRDRIFEIYFRGSKYSKGNGLGLYVVQTAVKKLNGSMLVTSEDGEYTQFDITFKV